MKADGPSFQSTGGWIGHHRQILADRAHPRSEGKGLSRNFRHVTQDKTDVYQVDYRGDRA